MALVDTPDLTKGFWLVIGAMAALVVASLAMSAYSKARGKA